MKQLYLRYINIDNTLGLRSPTKLLALLELLLFKLYSEWMSKSTRKARDDASHFRSNRKY